MISKNKDKRKEGFVNTPVGTFLSILHLAICIFAIFVSFKCNPEFSILHFIFALLCPQFYLIYIAATKGLSFCM